MTLELKDWVEHVFGQADPDRICRPDQATLLRLAEVFERPAELLMPYSDEVLGQAFWDLSSGAFQAVYKLAIDWAVRLRFIGSFETLFRGLFAVRCAPALGHCSEEGSRLNTVCYMWWDFDCWHAIPDPLTRNPFDSAFLESMRAILAIDHVACQESALHGLGHWHWAHSAEVEAIIDEFVKNQRHLTCRLTDYAASARLGCVL